MSFGGLLNEIFMVLTKDQILPEIGLFNKLQSSFIIMSHLLPNIVTDIIHGRKGFVKFKVKANYVENLQGTFVTKELGDLVFIVVSPSEGAVRLAFIQNKLSHEELTAFNEYAFYGDLLQLDLLKNRPNIIGNSQMYRLINQAVLPSICSYGVFAPSEKKTNAYDMKYFSADKLEPINPVGLSSKRKIRLNDKMGIRSSYGNVEQVDSCDSLVSFGDSVINMLIGEQLSCYDFLGSLNESINIEARILNSIRRIFLYNQDHNIGNDHRYDDINDHDGINEPDNANEGSSLAKTIVILNSDESIEMLHCYKCFKYHYNRYFYRHCFLNGTMRKDCPLNKSRH